MRRFILLPFVYALLVTPIGAQAPDPQLIAPIQKFMDTFNKGDIAGAKATHAAGADLTIIDELPPFVWRGPQAFETWTMALDAMNKQGGITDQKVTTGAPTRIESSGDSAYVVLPTVLTYKEKGVAMRETAQMTFALKKGAGGWLIHGWTWTGAKPRRVAAAKK
jgi:hypothetical protein